MKFPPTGFFDTWSARSSARSSRSAAADGRSPGWVKFWPVAIVRARDRPRRGRTSPASRWGIVANPSLVRSARPARLRGSGAGHRGPRKRRLRSSSYGEPRRSPGGGGTEPGCGAEPHVSRTRMSLEQLLAWISPRSPDESLARQVNFERLPAHVAIIMDGNGRWAAQRHLPRVEGH